MRKLNLFFITVFFLIGCASQKPLTREESLNLRNEQIAATTKTYNDVTKDDVLIAVDKLFRLCDGDDFKITHTENAILGNRRWLVYLVLAAAFGQDQWIVAAEDVPNTKSVKVAVRVSTVSHVATPMMTTAGTSTWSIATLPGIENTIPGKALYFIFFNRLDYLLGKTNKWLDCIEAKKVIDEQKIKGKIEPLCNPFNIDDLRPTE